MWEEIENLDMVGYELPEGRSEEDKEKYRNTWSGLGIMDYVYDSRMGMMDARSFRGKHGGVSVSYDGNGDPITIPTDVSGKTDYIISVAQTIAPVMDRTRITKISSGGSLFWHSHCRFWSGNYDPVPYSTMIVHVPIKTNPGVKFGVTRWPNQTHGIDPIWEHYSEGETWVLNSWHEHTVENHGDDPRYHLMMYAPIRGYFEDILKRTVSQYNGPLLPEE